MKKKSLSIMLIVVMSVLCIGCGKDKGANQPVTDTENVIENTEESTEEVKVESSTVVEDQEIITDIKNLLVAENAFRMKLDTEWPDGEKQYEIDEKMYRLVTEGGATSWDYYEGLAKEFYSEEYIKEEFTPFYTAETELFVEKDGKLYRAEADGVAIPLREDTMEVFKNVEEKYYVTVFIDVAGEEVEEAYIIRKAEGKTFGYEILEKLDYVK